MTSYDSIITCDQWECAICGKRRSEHGDAHQFERRTFSYVAMLRVKSEARWIAEVIESILPLCEKVFVLDDRSTDNTAEILGRYPQVTVFQDPFEGLNEARDKNWLYDQIIKYCEPKYILCIDGDEVLEKNGPAAIRRHCEEYPEAKAFRLKVEFLWNNAQTVRADRIYNDFWRPSIFRPFIERPDVPDDRKQLKDLRFMETKIGRCRACKQSLNDCGCGEGSQPNLHCSSVPQAFIHEACRVWPVCPARLKHYGYMERAWRIGKLDYYTWIDWNNVGEDAYRHMCQGDWPQLSELPKIRALIADPSTDFSEGDLPFLLEVPPMCPPGCTHPGVIWRLDGTVKRVDRDFGIPHPCAYFGHAGPIELRPWNEDAPWELSNFAKGIIVE